MAEMTAGPNGSGSGIPAGKLVNIAAAVMSVGLVLGVGVWGYKLLMRDVTGVPVVRAMEGEMRVAPEVPGGEIAVHTGLSVNNVPALGGAAAPEDRLVLAPMQPALEAEDLEVTPSAEAAEIAAAPQEEVVEEEAVAAVLEEDPVEQTAAAMVTPVDPSTPLTAEDVLALADQIAAGAAPMTDLAEGEDAPVSVAVNGVDMDPNLIPASVPGVSQSLRPTPRPAGRPAPTSVEAVAEAPPTNAAATPITGEVTTAALPAGTKLVQLGAFDSADIAATEWVRMTARFPDFFDGKDQIIQEAVSGGRTFYRLRAMGFADLSDARRFCSALVAEDAACIPVVVR